MLRSSNKQGAGEFVMYVCICVCCFCNRQSNSDPKNHFNVNTLLFQVSFSRNVMIDSRQQILLNIDGSWLNKKKIYRLKRKNAAYETLDEKVEAC